MVDTLVIWLIAGGVAVVTLIAEVLHGRRIRRLGALAFGPAGRPSNWTGSVFALRPVAAGLLAWGLLTLLFDVEPKVHKAGDSIGESDWRHMVLVLDVSPSMRLQDAGPTGEQSRLHRARDVLDSMFERVAMGRQKVSIIATYNGALPVVEDTRDLEVIRDILSDLPMHYAFKKGKTKLFAGIEAAAKLGEEWDEDTATLLVVSDGQTIPPKGMPKLPKAYKGTLIIGIGDPKTGTFIDGEMSRQDVSTLRQLALRLGGTYHNGNDRQVASSILSELTQSPEESTFSQLTKREYALMAVAGGATLLALLPLLLHRFGTSWRSGRPVAPRGRRNANSATSRRSA